MDHTLIFYIVGIAFGYLAGYNYHRLDELLFDKKENDENE